MVEGTAWFDASDQYPTISGTVVIPDLPCCGFSFRQKKALSKEGMLKIGVYWILKGNDFYILIKLSAEMYKSLFVSEIILRLYVVRILRGQSVAFP